MIPPLVDRFVAGETTEAAIAHAESIDDRGIGAILNRLGEHYEDREAAAADTDAYCELIEALPESIHACLSVKPSQLGLFVDEAVFRENLDQVVATASSADRLVWLDMEGYDTIDATIDAFEAHATAGDRIGICLQANLARTVDDIERLAGDTGKIRLVKGAYDPPAGTACAGGDVDEAYRTALEQLFETHNGGIAVGSHDPEMIRYARERHAETGAPFEVQMLMGVRTEEQVRLANMGVDVWQYVPYGEQWASYFYRRVTERWENLAFALRAVAGR